MDTLKIKLLRAEAKLPARATEMSAGYDLSAAISESMTIAAGKRVLIPTGIAIEIPSGTAAFIFARSGLGIKHGVSLSNGVGVVDADYRGEIMVGLQNLSDTDYTVLPGDRIAQMVIMPVMITKILQSDILIETARGAEGLGSTGR